MTGMTGKIRLAAMTRITRMTKCFYSSGLHVPTLLEQNTYTGCTKKTYPFKELHIKTLNQ